MSSTVASLLFLAIIAIAAAPLILVRSGRLAIAFGAVYGVALAGIVAYNTGLFSASALASSSMEGIRTAAAPPAECEQVLTLLERNHVILDRRASARLVVRQSLWAQLPQEAQAAVLACLESNRSPDDMAGPVQVIGR